MRGCANCGRKRPTFPLPEFVKEAIAEAEAVCAKAETSNARHGKECRKPFGGGGGCARPGVPRAIYMLDINFLISDCKVSLSV